MHAARTQSILALAAEIESTDSLLHGVEADLVRVYLELHACGHMDDRLPMSSADAIACEVAFRFGRADIVMFHVDGSATVIEAKDGARGYNHVVSGIGQAGLYAAQLAATKGAVTRVRRALLYSSTGSVELDGLIEEVCEAADVVPLPMPTMRTIVAVRAAARRIIEGVSAS